MANTYTLNERAVERARELIEARQYVLDSDWGERPAARRRGERLPGVALVGGVRAPGTSA